MFETGFVSRPSVSGVNVYLERFFDLDSCNLTLLITLCLCMVICVRPPTHSPIVIIPGTGGSRLEAKLQDKLKKPAWYCYSSTAEYFTLWFDMFAALPGRLKCWADNIRLEWNMKEMKAENVYGVLTQVPFFGSTAAIEALDDFGVVPYLKPLVENLVAIGYEKGKDLRGAPYDFRYSPDTIPDDYLNKLKMLVEETYVTNGNTTVTLLSHSYGCSVTMFFLSLQTDSWKKKFLKQWIALSGPFGGTIVEVLVYLAGYVEEPFMKIIDGLEVREGQRSFTSNLFLLPSPIAWSKDYVITRTSKRNYTVDQIDEVLKNMGFSEGMKMRSHIINSSSLMNIPPGIPIFCFHGNKPESTIKEVMYYSDNNFDFPDKPSGVILGSGDGTVNTESLTLCEMFQDIQNETVVMEELPGVGHLDILSNGILHSSVEKLLRLTNTSRT